MATNKTEKYSRIIILMAKGCTKLVRIFTVKTIEKSTPAVRDPYPWTIDQFIEYHKMEIDKKKPNPKQRRLLFPACESAVDIEEWDIQLICFILLGFCSVTTEMGMDLQELNKLRNKLCHKGDASISDAEYDGYLSKLKSIIQRLLKEINDCDLENEIVALVEHVEHGALSMDDTINVMKHWFDRETHIETQMECLAKEQNYTSNKLDTLKERLEDRLDEFDKGQLQLMAKLNYIMSRSYPEITISETEVKLIVQHCNQESEKFISEKLVKLLDNKLLQGFQDEHCISDRTLAAIKKCVSEAMSDLLNDGKEVVNVKQSCVIIRLKCPSFQSLRDLWTKCVQGELTKLFEPVQNAIREIDGFNSVCIEVILTESEFWRCMETLVSALTKCAEQGYVENENEPSKITTLQTSVCAVVSGNSSTDECASGSNGNSGTCIRMRIKPQSFDQLLHIWHTCKSGRLNRHLERVSEAFQDEFDLHDLSIKATIDEENMLDYLTDFGSAEMKAIDGDGTGNTADISSTGHSQDIDNIPVEHHTERDCKDLLSTAVSPQQEEQKMKLKKDDETVTTTDTDIGQPEDESKDSEGVRGTMLEDDVKKDIELLSTVIPLQSLKMDTDIGQMEYERKDDEGVGDMMLGDKVKKDIGPLSTMLEEGVKTDIEPLPTVPVECATSIHINMATYSAQINAKRVELSSIKKEIDVLEDKITTLEDETQQLNDAAEKLQNRASDLDREAAGKTDAGIFGRLASIFVGIVLAPFTGGLSLLPAFGLAGINAHVNYQSSSECRKAASDMRNTANDKRKEADKCRSKKPALVSKKDELEIQIRQLEQI